jgi:hypothetical protein
MNTTTNTPNGLIYLLWVPTKKIIFYLYVAATAVYHNQAAGHSANARASLKKYQIGIIKKSIPVPEPEPNKCCITS